MITQDQMNRLFDVSTEVGVATALELLQHLRDEVADYDGKFIDGFDYAIRALEKTDEIVRGKEGNNADT